MQKNIFDEAYLSSKRYQKRMLIATIILIVAFTVFGTLFGGTAAAKMEYLENSMRFSASNAEQSYTIEILYEDIDHVDIYTEEQLPDLGEMLEGVKSRNLWCGKWENDLFGEYELYINPKIETWIVISTETGVFVLNVEDSKATGNVAEGIIEILRQDGHW